MTRKWRTGDIAWAALLGVGGSIGWLGIPALSLWLLSRATDRYVAIYLGALLVAAPAMAGWGWCLHRIGRAPNVVAASATIAVIVAFVAFAAWIVFLGAHGNGAAPGAW